MTHKSTCIASGDTYNQNVLPLVTHKSKCIASGDTVQPNCIASGDSMQPKCTASGDTMQSKCIASCAGSVQTACNKTPGILQVQDRIFSVWRISDIPDKSSFLRFILLFLGHAHQNTRTHREFFRRPLKTISDLSQDVSTISGTGMYSACASSVLCSSLRFLCVAWEGVWSHCDARLQCIFDSRRAPFLRSLFNTPYLCVCVCVCVRASIRVFVFMCMFMYVWVSLHACLYLM